MNRVALLCLLLLSVVTNPAFARDLRTAATASPRPQRCLEHQERKRLSSVWRKASEPSLQDYCDLIARAHARLTQNPKQAGRLAVAAAKMQKKPAEAFVMRGRAAAASANMKAAVTWFEKAREIRPRSVDSPVVMADHALALWRQGQRKQALRIYQSLVPRIGMLPTRDARGLTLLRASHLTLALADKTPKAAKRKEMLQRALSYLRLARRDTEHPHRFDVNVSLAWALVLANRLEAAEVLLSQEKVPRDFGPERPLSYVDSPLHARVLQAIAHLRDRPRKTQSLLEPLSKAPQSPWRSSTKQLLKRAKAKTR